MAQLTIEIPDTLLPKLEPLRSQLPGLLSQWVIAAQTSRQHSMQPTAYQEVLSFLVSQPTLQDILSFKVSDSAQMRLRELLNCHREDGLSEDEAIELNGYEQLDQLMQLLKAQAYSAVQQVKG
jgi:hypothetical protein